MIYKAACGWQCGFKSRHQSLHDLSQERPSLFQSFVGPMIDIVVRHFNPRRLIKRKDFMSIRLNHFVQTSNGKAQAGIWSNAKLVAVGGTARPEFGAAQELHESARGIMYEYAIALHRIVPDFYEKINWEYSYLTDQEADSWDENMQLLLCDEVDPHLNGLPDTPVAAITNGNHNYLYVRLCTYYPITKKQAASILGKRKRDQRDR